MQEEEQYLEYYLEIPSVLWHAAQIIPQRLECCNFVVELRVGVEVVANAVHDLPLLVGESRQQQKVPIEALLMVHKVMANPHQTNHQWGT